MFFAAICSRLGRPALTVLFPPASPLDPYIAALGVGNSAWWPCEVPDEKDPVPEVRGTKGRRWKSVPFNIVPAGGKVSKNVETPSNKQAWNVFHEDELGS